MAIPDFQSIMLPFLEILQDGQVRTTAEVTDLLADRFKLTEQERQELMQSGQTHFYNRVAWAKTHLKNAGLIDNPTRGKVSISEAGRKVLGQKPSIINCKFLKQFPSYLQFIGQAPGLDKKEEAVAKDEIATESTKTPEETLEASYQAIGDALAVEVLDRVKSCSWKFFERLVVELLVTMGYGGSFAEAAQVVGRTGDGGIDGLINEDKLGLEAVTFRRNAGNIPSVAPKFRNSLAAWRGLRPKRASCSQLRRFPKRLGITSK